MVGIAGLALFPVGGGLTLCPFALLTGTACPGCGLTRAGAALVRGDLGAAWELHPLIPVVVAWVAASWAVGVLWRAGRRVPIPPRTVNLLLNVTGFAFVATWLVRLVTGTLPPV